MGELPSQALITGADDIAKHLYMALNVGCVFGRDYIFQIRLKIRQRFSEQAGLHIEQTSIPHFRRSPRIKHKDFIND